MLQLVSDIGAITAVITALLYYFGWVRTRFQARALGFDASVMQLGTTDYILKSLNVLFTPLTVLIIAALALNVVHARFVVPAIEVPTRRTAVLRMSTLLRRAWILLFPIAVILLASPIRGYALPAALTIATLCALYSRALRRRVTGNDPWSTATRAIVLVLLALGLFWATERLARTMGEAFAADFASNPQQLAAVTIYSAKDLEIDASGVDEEHIGTSESEYRYRYTGLYLLERSGDKYFLITTGYGRVIALRESDSLRMEFGP